MFSNSISLIFAFERKSFFSGKTLSQRQIIARRPVRSCDLFCCLRGRRTTRRQWEILTFLPLPDGLCMNDDRKTPRESKATSKKLNMNDIVASVLLLSLMTIVGGLLCVGSSIILSKMMLSTHASSSNSFKERDRITYNELPTNTRFFHSSSSTSTLHHSSPETYTSYYRKSCILNTLIVIGIVSVIVSLVLSILAETYLPEYKETGSGIIYEVSEIRPYLLPTQSNNMILQCNFTASYYFYVNGQRFEGQDIIWQNTDSSVTVPHLEGEESATGTGQGKVIKGGGFTVGVAEAEESGVSTAPQPPDNSIEETANQEYVNDCQNLQGPIVEKAMSGINVSVSYNADDPSSDNTIFYDDSTTFKIWTWICIGWIISILSFTIAIALLSYWKRE